jgi:sugar/nucleoside kinase (ribokinase family)
VVLVDASGERTFISHHGAERELGPEWDDGLDAASFKWLLLSGYSLYKRESASALAPWLEALPKGPKLLLDPGPMVADIPKASLDIAMRRADWVSANLREAAALTGKDHPRDACAELASGRSGAIVRIGAEGCWLASVHQALRLVPGFAVDAIDTNGAGDTHDGAFIAAMSFGHTEYDAAVIANAAAAIASTQFGPAMAPHRDEVDAFLASRGIALTVAPILSFA